MYKAVDVNNVYKAFFRSARQGVRIPRQYLVAKNSRTQANNYGDQDSLTVAVDHVSFSVERGEIFGLLGPQGSGKSTIIRLLAGLLIPDEGEIRIFGYDLASHLHQAQRQINNVSVQASFFRKLTPLENLVYSARMSGLSTSETHILAQELLERMGIDQHDSNKPMSYFPFSGMQKIRIAHALLTCPRLLLLDEPTTGLDPSSKLKVSQIIQEYNQEHGTTVFLTLNEREDAENLCNRITEISAGKLTGIYHAQKSQHGSAADQFTFNQDTLSQERSEYLQALNTPVANISR